MSPLDPRLNVHRPDLASVHLKHLVGAARYVEDTPAQCKVALAGIFKQPSDEATQLTQMLLGETMGVFERRDGWAWVQLDDDSYVGYVREAALRTDIVETTHRVRVPLTHLFPQADIKSRPPVSVSMNARLKVDKDEGEFARLASGHFANTRHISTASETDFVSVAEQFLHTPYLWGGKSVVGIDCSGLVQVALQACGLGCPRDSDMQEQGLGQAVEQTDMRRGDLVFWKGHVGIMQDAKTLLHANGHHMMVVSEPLQKAVSRIASKGSAITAVKRIQ
jgi:cell wall-associated NlpC family hydrolase